MGSNAQSVATTTPPTHFFAPRILLPDGENADESHRKSKAETTTEVKGDDNGERSSLSNHINLWE